MGAPVASASAGAALMWSLGVGAHDGGQTPVAYGCRDGIGVVGSVDHDPLVVVTEQCSRPVDRTREGCLAERGGRSFPSDRFLVIE